jgi:hypothetical protein
LPYLKEFKTKIERNYSERFETTPLLVSLHFQALNRSAPAIRSLVGSKGADRRGAFAQKGLGHTGGRQTDHNDKKQKGPDIRAFAQKLF